jgi:hypothetical protein
MDISLSIPSNALQDSFDIEDLIHKFQEDELIKDLKC